MWEIRISNYTAMVLNWPLTLRCTEDVCRYYILSRKKLSISLCARGIVLKKCLLGWNKTIKLTEYLSIISFKYVFDNKYSISSIVSLVVVLVSFVGFHILQNYSEFFSILSFIYIILKCSQVKYVLGQVEIDV